MSMLKVLGWKLCNPGWLVAGENAGESSQHLMDGFIVTGQLRNKFRKEKVILVES